MKKRIVALLLVLSLALTLAGCSGNQGKCDNCGKTATVHNAEVNGEQKKLCADCMADLVKQGLESLDAEEGDEDEPKALTLADIQARSGEDYACVMGENGFVTFLRGNFYDDPVVSEGDAEKALNSVQHLIVGDDDITLRLYGVMGDDNGYTYYSYHQLSGETAVEGAMLKLVVSPDGLPTALASSVKPGVFGNLEATITEAEAVSIVREALNNGSPGVSYRFYEDHTHKIVVMYEGQNFLCYGVYTNNPEGEPADGKYMAHYVTSLGQYLYGTAMWMPGSSEVVAGGDNTRYFQGTPEEYTGEVTYSDGSKVTLTVPVLYSEADGCYYMADQKRKIAVGDFLSLAMDRSPALTSSPENGGWDDYALIVYANMIRVYDAIASTGWKSTDGLGTPIYIGDNFPDDGASFCGPIWGWQVFGVPRCNRLYECLDVEAHEYTHGLQMGSSGIVYRNQSGAIAESLADIFGNIVEMMAGETEDETWMMSERVGAIRCMTDPNRFGQPEFIGDVFYAPDVKVPHYYANDYGGVHINNSLLAGVAPKLYKAGMPLEKELQLWITVLCELTPGSNYRDVQEMLKFAADVCGLSGFKPEIDKAFSEAGMDGTVIKREKDGYGQVRFVIRPYDEESCTYGMRMWVLNGGGTKYRCWPGGDSTGTVDLKLPAGSYTAGIIQAEQGAENFHTLYKTSDGWSEDADQACPVIIENGETTELVLELP